MNMKFEIAEDAAKLALKVPGAADAAAHAVTTAGRLLEETMPRSMTSTIHGAEERAQHLLSQYEAPKAAINWPGREPRPAAAPEPPSIKDYDVSHYKAVPARTMMREIRTAGGVSLQHIDGPSRVVFDEKNAVQHVLVNRDATDVERDKHLLTAAYAGLIHDDVLAQEAAGKVLGQSIGFISRPIERFATPAEMQQNAVDGAREYFNRSAAGGNNYTKFLTDRFGPANFEESRSVVNPYADAAQKSDSLVPSGIPITPENRAAAAARPYVGPLWKTGHALDEARDAGTTVNEAHIGRIIPPLSHNLSTFKRDIIDVRSPEFKK